MKIASMPAPAFVLCLLAGCFGSDGDGGSGFEAGIADAEILATNALVVARATLTATAGTEDAGTVDSLLAALGTPPRSPVRAAGTRPSATAAAGFDNSGVNLCQTGTVMEHFTLGDPDLLRFEDRLAPGDNLRFDFTDCELRRDVLFEGGLDFQVERFIGSLNNPAIEYLLDFRLRNLRIELATTAALTNGDLSLFFDSTTFPFVYTALSGQRLTISDPLQSATLREYDLANRGTLAKAPNVFRTIDTIYDGRLTSTEFQGEVRFQTIIPFRTDGQLLSTPFQGQMEIYGAEDAILRVTVVDDSVQLRLDADADGIFEHSELTTWAVLTNAI